MRRLPELEIILALKDGEGYPVHLRYEEPGAAERPRDKHGQACFDFAQLRGLNLEPLEYGKALAGMLFKDNDLEKFFTGMMARCDGRMRLVINIAPGAPELHNLRWETLANPLDGNPLATNENLLLSRYLESQEWESVERRPRGELRALAAAANPSDLGEYQQHEVDVEGEIRRAKVGLAGIRCDRLPKKPGQIGQVTLENLMAALHQPYDILYLACHGASRQKKSETEESSLPALFLEKSDGTTHRVDGNELIRKMRELDMAKKPRLIFLASCQSAGTGAVADPLRSADQGMLAALGPQLAAAGAPAVIAMQGDITMKTMEEMLPVFFEKLASDGQLDRAMAAARGRVSQQLDWWVPVLYTRFKDGCLFSETPARPEAPLQLLPKAEHFVGREKELSKLLAKLKPGAVAEICGPGGMGKTALAAEALQRLTKGGTKTPKAFPDGIVVHSFNEQPDINQAFEHIVRSFGGEAKPTPAVAAALLARKQALLVLDGAEQAEDLKKLVDICRRCGVLITSRKRGQAAADWQDLQPLKITTGVKLLKKWGKRRARNEAACRRICKLVGGLPMAIVLAGSFLKECEIDADEYASWLEETPLEALNQGKRRMESVPVLLERSLAEAGEEARAAMGVVGLLGMAPFEWRWVQIGMEAREGEAIQAIGKLVMFSLVRRTNGSYVVSHALVHTYARKACKAKDGALTRLGELFSQIDEEESGKGVEGLHRLDQIQLHILPVLEQLARDKEWEAADKLGKSIEPYLDMQGLPSERIRVAQTGIEIARGTKDRGGEGYWLNILGLAYFGSGQDEKAIENYQQALTIASDIGDKRLEGKALGNLGNVYVNQGQFESAIDCHQRALVIDRELINRQGEVEDLVNLGVAFSGLGQYEKAIENYQQALKIARKIPERQIPNRRVEGKALDNLGVAYANQGKLEKAIERFQQALKIAQEIGDRRGEGKALGNLGCAYAEMKQFEKAIENYNQALEIHRKIDDRRGVADDLNNLGIAYQKLENMPEACKRWKHALKIYEKLKSPEAENVRSSLEKYCREGKVN